MISIVQALGQVLAAFDALDVPYAVGGSVASSMYGNYRMTNDVDILVDMRPGQVCEFVERLGPDFVADIEELERAFQTGRHCNLISQKIAFKFDLFPAMAQEFERSELARRENRQWELGDEQIELFSVSVEDILLAKLRWYRQGNEVSENQWRDIEGILTVRGENLDFTYLRSWAMRLDVADLLEQATRNLLSDKGNSG